MSFNVFNLSELQSVFRGVFDNYEEHLASLDKIIDNAGRAIHYSYPVYLYLYPVFNR